MSNHFMCSLNKALQMFLLIGAMAAGLGGASHAAAPQARERDASNRKIEYRRVGSETGNRKVIPIITKGATR